MQEKSIYFRLPKTGKEGFLVQHDQLPHFYDRLHYHPELQLVYIIQGTGDLFISDTIVPFEAGNLFLIGSNQSHLFKSDSKYFQGNEDLVSESVSVFFHESSLGDGFFNISEMASIRNMIERSGRGIRFSVEVSKQFREQMCQLPTQSGFTRFLNILSLLNELSASQNYRYLATVSSPDPMSDIENKKVNDVINYIFKHYKEDIKLKEVAQLANYSQTAFCLFFKQRTRKTFVQFLNEVRVSQACKLLRNSDFNISQICFESGFNNVSNFNRQFKKVVGFSPSAYKSKFEKSIQISEIH
ncbi:MAG: AraC family transcriptional regulator [Balneolaceae bacterium]